MSTFNVNVSAFKSIAERLGNAEKINAALLEGMQEGTARLANYTADSKLEGQVLHHRSGRLSSSVRHPPAPTSDGAGRVTGYIKSVFYGKVHEYGATINSPVLINGVGWRYIKALPARPWLEPSLQEGRALVTSALRRALRSALEGN